MKTTCAMVIDTLIKLKNHLHQAHEMQPDFHITMTHECRADVLQDIEAHYQIIINASGKPNTIAGYGFSVVREQEQPYRIWIGSQLQ